MYKIISVNNPICTNYTDKSNHSVDSSYSLFTDLDIDSKMLTTTNYITKTIPRVKQNKLLEPEYTNNNKSELRLALAVENMRHHMTDEGWQIMEGLSLSSSGKYANSYSLCGHNLPINLTDTKQILAEHYPKVMVIQDKREWDVTEGNFRIKDARFHNVNILENPRYNNIFKLTILKDSHQKPNYHRESAREMGVHAWIIYYHPTIVAHLASYVRPQHLIRTYHSIDPLVLPPGNELFDKSNNRQRKTCILSGAVSHAYPLRLRLSREIASLYQTDYYKHPGYHNNGCCTPNYLKLLSNYKISICTASRYGYALRKIIESTAVGCRVITDLPVDDYLPEIDGNLIRVSPNIRLKDLNEKIKELANDYDIDKQYYFAEKALLRYNYREIGQRLANDIENMRLQYNEQG